MPVNKLFVSETYGRYLAEETAAGRDEGIFKRSLRPGPTALPDLKRRPYGRVAQI